MPRWDPDAQGRLERAALDLFESQGFERTSVAQIARTAGLGERSFYRYFPDKREVLFAGDEFASRMVAQLEAVDPALVPIEALLTALAAAEEMFPPRDLLLRRRAVIAANPALSERELIKLADIAAALALAVERRGAEPDGARFVVDVAMAIFWRATSRWLADPDAALAEHVSRATDELRAALAPVARRPAATANRSDL